MTNPDEAVERDAVVCTDSWAGRSETRVKVLLQTSTPTRYRVRYLDNAVRRRVGDEVLVPRHAVRFSDGKPAPAQPMRALTLIQPWAHAIAHLGKDVENRSWRPPGEVLGQRIAIHAGKTCSDDNIDTLRELGYELPDVPVASAIVATVRLVGWVRSAREHSASLTEHTVREVLRSPWRVDGAIAWVLRDVQAVKPISCKGARGLWEVSQALLLESQQSEPPAARPAENRLASPPQRTKSETTGSAVVDPRQLQLFDRTDTQLPHRLRSGP